MDAQDPRVSLVTVIRNKAIKDALELDKQRLTIRGLVKLRSLYAMKDYGVF